MVPVEKSNIGSHSKKDVEVALTHFRTAGWYMMPNSGGHGIRIGCPHECKCSVSVSSTPKNPGNHAIKILRILRKCPGNMES
jgi:hypothetical protein